MNKSLAIIAIAITLTPVAMSSQQQAPTRERQREAEQANQPSSVTTNDTSTHYQQSSADNPKGWHKLVTWPEGITTWALLLTLGAIVWQAIETRRSVQAVRESLPHQKDAADAALLNAQAVITESRPWMLVPRGEFGDKIENPPLMPVKGSAPHIEVFPHCKFWIQNYGKTPAKIIFLKAELQVGDSQVRPPDYSVYGVKETSGTPYVFPQGESEARIAKLREDSTINAGSSIDPRSQFLWLCGFIKYRDTFDREKPIEYETRFCYVYLFLIPGGQWTAGPEQCNGAI